MRQIQIWLAVSDEKNQCTVSSITDCEHALRLLFSRKEVNQQILVGQLRDCRYQWLGYAVFVHYTRFAAGSAESISRIIPRQNRPVRAISGNDIGIRWRSPMVILSDISKIWWMESYTPKRCGPPWVISTLPVDAKLWFVANGEAWLFVEDIGWNSQVRNKLVARIFSAWRWHGDSLLSFAIKIRFSVGVNGRQPLVSALPWVGSKDYIEPGLLQLHKTRGKMIWPKSLSMLSSST